MGGAKMNFQSKEQGTGSERPTSSPLFEHSTPKTPYANADILLEVYFDLAETRKIAENASDNFLLYLIDMAIFHVSETLSNTQHPALRSKPAC